MGRLGSMGVAEMMGRTRYRSVRAIMVYVCFLGGCQLCEWFMTRASRACLFYIVMAAVGLLTFGLHLKQPAVRTRRERVADVLFWIQHY